MFEPLALSGRGVGVLLVCYCRKFPWAGVASDVHVDSA